MATLSTSVGVPSFHAIEAYFERWRTTPMGEWTPYTPTFSTNGGGTSMGNGYTQGYYSIVGKTVTMMANIQFGTTTVIGSGYLLFDLPPLGPMVDRVAIPGWVYTTVNFYLPAALGADWFIAASPLQLVIMIERPSDGLITLATNTFPHAWGANTWMWFSGTYRIA